MRISLALVLMTALYGCGSSSGNGPPDGSTMTSDGGLPPPLHGFQIIGPTVEVAAGTEVTFCYYFRTPNASDLAIKQWASRMTGGGHHMVVYFTRSDQQAPGTLSASKCGFYANGVGPVWTYAAVDSDHEAALPADDGNGLPVAQIVKAGQSGFIEMHFQNSTDAVLRPHVELNAYAYADGVQVTHAAPFVTYNTQIDLAPAVNAVTPTTGMVTGSCKVTSDAKFYLLSTHTHKQGIHAYIRDGASTVFTAASWDHPGERRWDSPPFQGFATGSLGYQCDYSNPNSYRIEDGDDMATDETCMAIGYYFPAADDNGHLCVDSVMVY